MTTPDEAQGATSGRRHGLAHVLCGLLLGVGVLLTEGADAGPRWATDVSQPILVTLLTVLYYGAHRYSVDFELRRESHSVTLVQLPLALGVVLIAPMTHLAARLAAVLALAVRQRQEPLKALYNLAAAAFEVGTAAWAVGLLDADATGPLLWLALYAGLLAGDVVGSLVLSAVWRLIGVPVTLRAAVRTLLVVAPVSLLFTALAIVALSAVGDDEGSWVVVVLLAGGLALAYRTHRKVVGQQQATQRLYDFVKDLGPLDLDSPAADATLERMRLLLHAQRLDLALHQGGRWCHLVAQDGRPPRRTLLPAGSAAPRAAAAGLGTRQRGLEDTMATPLLAGTELAGLLTATGRLGAARGFDMGDLRLLETVGAELATALDRGRLLTDLERSATTDALTGLPNLAEVSRRLNALIAEHADVVVAAVAVDSFREVNDTLGREVGDDLLCEVSRRLPAAYPDGVVGRVGGARFVLAVPSESIGGEPEHFGLALRSRVEGAAQLGAVGTHVRLSVGLATAPEHGADSTTLVRRAETAMYGARRVGGGPVVWEPAYEVLGNRRLAVVMALREALSAGAIAVAYQPKVTTRGGEVTGVEALARWTHPALGVVAPDEFVPLAEASGLMGSLTASVLRQSLASCHVWQGCAPGVGVSVNVSADTLLGVGFVREVGDHLAETGLAASLLTLELTESVLLADPLLAAERMRELRRLGVKLSVDDFGTGYSSLTYLRGLPVDEVKVDKGFVDGLVHDPADQAVVRAVVDIAHTLGMRVVVEGIEHEEQMTVLFSLGVDEVQGYLHARPLSRSEVLTWLPGRRIRRLS